MTFKEGNNRLNKKTYPHTPSSEKDLFRDILSDYLSKTKDTIKGIEIGVLYGETSSFLLSLSERIELIGIDPIVPDSMEKSLVGSVLKIHENVNAYKERFEFIQEFSFLVCNLFDDLSFDFVFIDGDHTYEAVKKDFELYYSKIKAGGYIFMHDSRMYRGGAPFHEGSSKFCDELIVFRKDIEVIGEAFSLTCFRKK